MCKNSKYGVENIIQMLADIFSQKTQHKEAVLLQQMVLTPVTAVGCDVCKVLWSVKLDSQPRLCTA